jgi:excisionase family DNA binding protein
MARPIAYSYARFSTSEQERGDSERRQIEAARQYAEQHGFVRAQRPTNGWEMQPQIVIVSKIACGQKCEYIGAPTFSASSEHLLTCQETARYLQLHVETVRDFARKRRISYVRLGRCDIRFRRADLDEFVTSRLNVRRKAF